MSTKVAIQHLPNYRENEIERGLEKLLAELGGLETLIPVGTKRVMIKPNLVYPMSWDTGVTTNLTLVAKIAQMISEMGIEVVIGEGAGLGVSSQDTFEKLGVQALAKKIDVPLYDFKKGERIKIKINDGKMVKTVTVHKIVTECDFIISVPKLKTHCETVVSLSLKNMKGLVCSERERLKFHLLDVNQCLVDINRAFKPGLAIVEGLIGLEGIGPSSPGTPIDLGLLIGGQDAVAVDAVCTRIMRMEPANIRHIKLAAEANLGTMNFDEIEIQGEKLERVIPEYFEKPPSTIEEISPYQKIRIVNGNPCSNCIVGLASYLHAWVPKELAMHTKSELRILLGPKARMRRKGNEIALGNCLKRYKGKIPYISGCPPASDAYGGIIEDALRGKFVVYEDNIDSTLERITPNPYQ